MRNVIRDKSGLAWIWAISIISLALGAVVYFPLSYVWEHLYAYIIGDYTFVGDTYYGLVAMNFILSYLLAFGLVFTINWAIVNAKASSYE
jgi:hypothetical protein